MCGVMSAVRESIIFDWIASCDVWLVVRNFSVSLQVDIFVSLKQSAAASQKAVTFKTKIS
jgi:hypothetical protein